MKWPEGFEEIKQVFGDPRPYLVDGGLSVSEEWPRDILTRLELPAPLTLAWDPTKKVYSIRCHQLVKQSLGGILSKIHDAGLWKEIEPFGGVYCWRVQRDGTRLSTHCWGAAIDLRVREMNARGTPGDMPQSIVQAFEDELWTWGGRWNGSRCDGMHMQAVSHY